MWSHATFNRVHCRLLLVLLFQTLYLYPLNTFGTEEQKEKHMKPFMHGDRVGSFALSEPGEFYYAKYLQRHKYFSPSSVIVQLMLGRSQPIPTKYLVSFSQLKLMR